jgi:hypothetical protein
VARELRVTIVGDSASLEKALGRSSAAAQTFGAKMEKTGGSMVAFGKTMTTHVTLPIVALGAVMVKTALDGEKSTARLDTAFKNVGVSVAGSARAVDGMEASGRRLGFTNTQIRDSIGSLVTSTGSLSKSHQELAVAEDLARFKGVDLETATKALTMANAGSMRAIKQLGITIIPVTSAVDALKKAHQGVKGPIDAAALAAAKFADKQATIASVLDVVGQKVKGQGAAFASTAAGGMAQFRAQLENIGEKLGTALLPALNTLVGYLTRALNWFNNLSDGTKKWLGILAAGAAVIGPLVGLVGKLILAIRGVAIAMEFLVAGNPVLLGLSLAVAAAAGAFIFLKTMASGSFGVLYNNKAAVDALATSYTTLKAQMDAVTNTHLMLSQAQLNTQQSLVTLHTATLAWHADLAAGTTKTAQGVQDYISYRQAVLGVTTAKAALKQAQDASTSAGQRDQTVVKNAQGVYMGLQKRVAELWDEYRAGNIPQKDLISGLTAIKTKVEENVAAHMRLARQFESTRPAIAKTQVEIARYGEAILLVYKKGETFNTRNIQKELKNVPWTEFQRKAVEGGEKAHTGFLAGIGKVIGDSTKSVGGAVRNIGTFIGAAHAAGVRVGAAAGQGVVAGLDSKLGDVRAAAARIANAASAAMHTTLQTGSPSKVTYQIGQWFSEGFANGIGAGYTKIAARITDITNKAIALARQQLQTAMQNLASAISSFGSAALSGFDAAGGGTAETRALAAKVKGENAAIAAQQAKEQEASLNAAISSAQAKKSADTGTGADAATLAADQAAIDQAIQALQDYKDQQQAAADAASLAAKQKTDKDNFEKALAALEKEAGGANTETKIKAVQAKIAALFKKYGITPGTVEAGADWNASQTLFVQAMGSLKTAMEKLVDALGKLSGAQVAQTAGSVPKFAEGGAVPIIAHAGEYVIKASSAKKLGGPVLDRLNRYADGGQIPGDPLGDPNAIGKGGPKDTPTMRAAAMWVKDDGRDKYDKDVATALIGAIGPRAQAQAALRHTYTSDGFELKTGTWRAGPVDQKLQDLMTKAYPGIVFEVGTPGQQISAGQAVSRFKLGDGMLMGLANQSLGDSSIHSILSRYTSGAVHFANGGLVPGFLRGGVMPWDGLANLHRGERVTPAGPAGLSSSRTLTLEVPVMVDGREVGRASQSFLLDEGRKGRPGIAPLA